MNSHAQGSRLHDCICVTSPEQGAPPHAAGVSTGRNLPCWPKPHVAEQEPHGPQSPHTHACAVGGDGLGGAGVLGFPGIVIH